MKSNRRIKFGVVGALVFVCAMLVILLKPAMPPTTIEDASGDWAEPEGVGGAGILSIDAKKLTVSYSSSLAIFDIVDSEVERGWLVLKLHYAQEGWSIKLRIKKIDESRIICVDGDDGPGYIRERIPLIFDSTKAETQSGTTND